MHFCTQSYYMRTTVYVSLLPVLFATGLYVSRNVLASRLHAIWPASGHPTEAQIHCYALLALHGVHNSSSPLDHPSIHSQNLHSESELEWIWIRSDYRSSQTSIWSFGHKIRTHCRVLVWFRIDLEICYVVWFCSVCWLTFQNVFFCKYCMDEINPWYFTKINNYFCPGNANKCTNN